MGNDVCMWEMSLVFEKRLRYVGNEVDMREMAKICGEMAKLFDKRLKYVGVALEIWEIAKIFLKWLRYIGQG